MFEKKKEEKPLPIKRPLVKKDEPAAAQDGDFKNSLAALIGRGKPGMKKPKPESSTTDTVKVKVSNIFDEEEKDGGFSNVRRVR